MCILSQSVPSWKWAALEVCRDGPSRVGPSRVVPSRRGIVPTWPVTILVPAWGTYSQMPSHMAKRKEEKPESKTNCKNTISLLFHIQTCCLSLYTDISRWIQLTITVCVLGTFKEQSCKLCGMYDEKVRNYRVLRKFEEILLLCAILFIWVRLFWILCVI